MSLLLGILAGSGGRRASTGSGGGAGGGATPPQGTLVGKSHILFPGDSNTANGMYTTHVLTNLDPAKFDTDTKPAATAGYVIAQISQLCDYAMVQFFDHARNNIANVLAGTNDINNLGSATGAETDLTDLLTKLWDYGFKIIVNLFPDPGRNADGSTNKPQYAPFKSWIEGNWSITLRGDKFLNCSLYTNSIAGYSTANAAYWGDSVHWSPTGAETYGDLVIATATEIADTPSYYPDAPTNMVNAANAVSVDIPEGYTSADLQYTLNAGLSVQWVTTYPIPLPHNRVAGIFGVRVGPKIVNGVHNNPSGWLYNSAEVIGASGHGAPDEVVLFFDPRFTLYGFIPAITYLYDGPGGNETIAFEITEGFSFNFGGNWEVKVNGVVVGTADEGVGSYTYHSGTSSTKSVLVTGTVGGQNHVFSGVILHV